MLNNSESSPNPLAILYVRSVYDYCLDLQADVLYRYADEHGLVVVDLFVDRWGGGIGGGRFEFTAMNQL